MSFSDFGLSEKILRAVAKQGYTEPTPIQQRAIPAVMDGGDLLAGAQTGTGKTAGFVLPILHRLTDQKNNPKGQRRNSAVRALVLTPTRELAAQVEESVRLYGQYLSVKSLAVFGGVNIRPQINKLRNGVDVLVATPGRLLDHVGQRTVDLSQVEVLVLDEADRMLDMGFINDIRKILAQMPKERQNLLFSATFSSEIKKLANSLLNNPALIEAPRKNVTADTVAQKVYPVDRERKRELLSHLIREHAWHQVLVFTRTKHLANRLADQLDGDGIPSTAIHGNKSQGARTKALSKFKAGKVQVLVATDIAARGIDIDELPHVVNFELPNVAEDYVHRIGRTGRAGTEGEAVSLVCVDENRLLADIERLIKRKLPKEIVEGFEVDPSIRPKPIQNGRSQPSNRRRGGPGGKPGGQRRGGPGGRNGGPGGRKPGGGRPSAGKAGKRGKRSRSARA